MLPALRIECRDAAVADPPVAEFEPRMVAPLGLSDVVTGSRMPGTSQRVTLLLGRRRKRCRPVPDVLDCAQGSAEMVDYRLLGPLELPATGMSLTLAARSSARCWRFFCSARTSRSIAMC